MPSPEELKRLVRSQFGAATRGYVTASIFREGAEVARMIELAKLVGHETVLDIATGGGHIAVAFAPYVRAVVATDLTPEMLDAAARFAEERGAGNVRFELADAEALAFAGDGFDVVTARFAPHHFPRPERFAGEAFRVLRLGGRLVMFDNMVPEDPELDAFMNRFEAWRDPSHIRAHRSSQWQAMLRAAGFRVEAADALVRKDYSFEDWTSRMGMPAAERDALERWLLDAPPRCAAFFRITAEHGRVRGLEATFGAISARKPGA